MADVFAFRLYYRFRLAGRDAVWSKQALADLQRRFPPVPANTAVLDTESPNTDEAAAFIREHQPDIMLALCKQIIKASVFTIPTSGTFVLHPGICPEYRNAHGCFWALANDDPQRVGMTLLRIDRGIDTGPVFGYFSYPFDELRESHIVIQHRVVLDNLDAIAARLTEVHQGTATPIPTGGRRSGEWGQPWLTSYLRRRRRASRSVDAYSRA
jgi:methionyl-tRNA formyltransferase